MATTLQQLLDDLTTRSGARPVAATIEDVTGALAHLGRALSGLADDGLTPTGSARQQTTTDLGGACLTVGRLWPRTGGPLTDLAGAAADLIGRDRAIMGRAHRWAVTVEVADAADACAQLGRRLLPQTAAPELDTVRQWAAAVERDAQLDPPTTAGLMALDRLVPQPDATSGEAQLTALDAAAALLTALDRARRDDDLTLRDFRAAVAAAELTSRYAALTVGRAGGDAGPSLVAGLAWQLAGRASMVFDDGRQRQPVDDRGVIAGSQALVAALRNGVGEPADTPEGRTRRTPADVAATIQEVVHQLPVLADRLTMAIDRWARTGQLYANARDLPPMDNMPENRVNAVIAGRHVQAHGADLDRLQQVVGRAAELSTGLVDALIRATVAGPPTQRHLADDHTRRSRAPGSPERLLGNAQGVAEAMAATEASRRRHDHQPRHGGP